MGISTETTRLIQPQGRQKMDSESMAPWALGAYLLPRSIEDSVVELRQIDAERVVLAHDGRVRRFVELHIVSPSKPLSVEEEDCVMANLAALRPLRLDSIPQILEVGKEQGITFYVTGVQNSIGLESWLAKLGRTEIPTAARLVHGLVRDLRFLEKHQPEVLPLLSLSGLQVVAEEFGTAHLALTRFALQRQLGEKSFGAGGELAVEAAWLFARLFTGSVGRLGVMDELRDSGSSNLLKETLASVFAEHSSCKVSLETLADALGENATINAGVVDERLSPMVNELSLSKLSGCGVNDEPLENLRGVLGQYFSPAALEKLGYFPLYADASGERSQPVLRLGLTPFASFLNNYVSPRVPYDNTKLQSARQPNIMPPFFVWEQGDLVCVVDEKPPGVSLQELVAERGRLSPPEVLQVLEQLAYALKQAEILGATRVDPHPAQIWLAAEVGKDVRGALIPWAGFSVKLRLHRSPESIFSLPIIDPKTLTVAAAAGAKTLEREYVLRSFPALAYYLLTGDSASRPGACLPDGISPEVRAFILDCHRSANEAKSPASPEWWTSQLRGLVQQEPVLNSRGLAAPLWVQPTTGTMEAGKPKTWVQSKSRPRTAWQLMA